ncbi:unnamed protein product [Camellia sinensis]
MPMENPNRLSNDEVRTIFISGLPEDVKERELQNLLRWLPHYEASQVNCKGEHLMGFALFTTPFAIAAKDTLQEMVFDEESKSVLHTEMAKKNLFVKRVVDPRFVWNRNILEELIENKLDGCTRRLEGPECGEEGLTLKSKVVERHFHDIIERYGETVAVDLTNKHGDEGQLSMAYATEMEKLPNVRYISFDFHHYCGRWIADAEENLGESEIREAHLAKSLFFIRIGDKQRSKGWWPEEGATSLSWPDGANKIGPLFASPLPVYMREVRTVVYSQFLESCKSVTIEAMAKAFGVTVEFIDLEMSRFIAAGKLHCKIDKVAGVLETNRPDAKNALYQATIKQGDFLLNQIQKLSRVIDL